MTLNKIVEEIKQIQPFADEDTTQGPIETLNARRGRKNQAIERLKQLKRSYSQEMLRTAVFIVTTGQDKDRVGQIAEDNFGFFVTDPNEFYTDLSNRVPPSLYLGKEGVSNIFDVLGRHLEDKMNELDINEYNQLIFKAEFAKKINDPKEFTELVKRAINKQIGAEIAGIQAVRSLVTTAIERNHADNITPIILSTNDEQLALDLIKDLERITSRVFLLVSGKSTKAIRSVEGVMSVKLSEKEEDAEQNKESVKEVLTQMRKQLKTK